MQKRTGACVDVCEPCASVGWHPLRSPRPVHPLSAYSTARASARSGLNILNVTAVNRRIVVSTSESTRSRAPLVARFSRLLARIRISVATSLAQDEHARSCFSSTRLRDAFGPIFATYDVKNPTSQNELTWNNESFRGYISVGS